MSRKITTKPSVQLLVLLVLAMVGATCSTPPPPSTNPPSNPPTPPPIASEPPTDAPPQTTGKADLSLGGAYIESNNDPNDTWNTYKIVLEISNLGNNADATGFDVFCNYECPAGDTTISDGIVVVVGGYLVANSSTNYKEPFHYSCTIYSPTVDLTCRIEYPDGGTQTFAPYQLHLP